jgi:17beta-estradiol 17-dehydrogenase / very-long-chain 3-oxoacyl-CoA reductase
VTSKLSKIRKPSLFTPTPTTFVKSALRTLGYEGRTSGYIFHDIQLWLAASLPKSVVDKQLWGMHLALRKRAMAKANKTS